MGAHGQAEAVNIIMVTWNAKDYTQHAVDSLYANTDSPYTLTVVDNGSEDGTQEFLHSLDDDRPSECLGVSVIENRENVGFGGAINQGYEDVEHGSLVCVANNDVSFPPGWLRALSGVIEAEPQIGILGPMRPYSAFRHPYSDRDTGSVLKGIPEMSPNDELAAYCDGDFERFVDDLRLVNDFGIEYVKTPPLGIVTCCAMLRSEVVDEVGGLADPAFEIYGSEDVDLSWRVAAAGYRLAITSATYVHHFKHRSANASGLDLTQHNKRNNVVFFDKWATTIHAFLRSEIEAGVDVQASLSDENNAEYWFLRRLHDNVGSERFFGELNPDFER